MPGEYCVIYLHNRLYVVPQELLSHVATSHLRSANQGITGTTQAMERLASTYETWRQKLQSTVALAQLHTAQHQKVIPMIQSTTGIASWRR